jgi:hypothetical protein
LFDRRTFEREKHLEFKDIQGSVDIYDRRRNIPLEFKTSRASDIKEPKIWNVEQLKYYMAMLDVPEGYMLYQLLPPFRRYSLQSLQDNYERTGKKEST